MVNSRNSLTVIVCLICVFQINPAFLRRLSHFKRFGQVPGTLESNDIQSSSLFFKGKGFKSVTRGAMYGSIVLECEAGGSPPPTIHWLKNGIRITQGSINLTQEDETSYEDRMTKGSNMLRLSSTRSRLFLDCLGKASQGQYACVAENALIRKSRTTFLKVAENADNYMYPDVKKCIGKKYKKGEPARIYMWTVSRLEYISNMVQLFCRAQGKPTPTITWYRESKPIQNDDDYQVTDQGDLIIKEITWERHRFSYYCVASNVYGTDAAEAFLYPTLQEDLGLPYE